MILSASSINEWLKCHRRWAYKYLYRMSSPQGVAPAIGTAVHAGIEAHYLGTEPPVDALRRSFDAEMALVPLAEVWADPDALPDALRALDAYLREVAPRWTPTMVERKFAFEWKGVTVTGIIDAADETTDTVADAKTTAGKTINGRKPHFYPDRYDLQLALYDLGYQALTGRPAKTLRLDVVTRRGTVRDYERNPSLQDALDIVEEVGDAIEHGEYDATGAWNGMCKWCQFTGVCPDARLD